MDRVVLFCVYLYIYLADRRIEALSPWMTDDSSRRGMYVIIFEKSMI